MSPSSKGAPAGQTAPAPAGAPREQGKQTPSPALRQGATAQGMARKDAEQKPAPVPEKKPRATGRFAHRGDFGSENDPETEVRKEVAEKVASAAEKAGIPAELAFAVASRESNFSPTIQAYKNGSMRTTAKGVFQFTDDSFDLFHRKYGEKDGIAPGAKSTDVDANIKLGIRHLQESAEQMRRNGLETSVTNVYLGNFLGPRAVGFVKTYKANPDAIAADLVPARFAKSNDSVFYTKNGTPKTVGEIYDYFDRELARHARKYSVETVRAPKKVAKKAEPKKENKA